MSKMDEETMIALEQSIAHWKRNAAASHPDDVKLGTRQCALCSLYYDAAQDLARQCTGCPVKARTGESLCGGTPYSKCYVTALLWTDVSDGGPFRTAANEMVEFLESLREEKPW